MVLPLTAMNLPPTYVDGFHDLAEVRKMKYRKLGDTGMVVSVLSFGASSLGSVFRKTDDEESVRVVHKVIKSGVNLIDTAPWYGHGKSERVLGMALKGVPRKAYYLNTKVGRYDPDVTKMFDFTAERTIRSVHESLERLGVDYIDCIQVHDPEFAPSIDILLKETLPALDVLRSRGTVRKIGITGYPLDFQREIIERSSIKIDTSLVYCHYSMNDRTLMDSFLPFLNDRGIGCINASPISMGLLSHRGPPSWHPASDKIKDVCKAASEHCASQDVNISKLAMHFTLSNEALPTTLVSTASMDRTISNLAAVSETLTEKEQRTSDQVMETFFNNLQGKDAQWLGYEVEKYWNDRKRKWEAMADDTMK